MNNTLQLSTGGLLILLIGALTPAGIAQQMRASAAARAEYPHPPTQNDRRLAAKAPADAVIADQIQKQSRPERTYSRACVDPPTFHEELTPTTDWQITSEVALSDNDCHVFKIHMLAGYAYDFSCCDSDGHGGMCTGDADFALFDPSGTQIWYLDGPYNCNYDATTIGSSYQGWSPPADGDYYLKVDDYYTSAMSFILAYKLTELFMLDCPPDAWLENEPCGDDTNGGCNSAVPAFEQINCGETVCGTAWAQTETRDTDWYKIIVDTHSTLTWSIIAEFPPLIFIVQPGSACDPCAGNSTIVSAFGAAGEPVTISADVPPGTYWLWAGPALFEDYPCTLNYAATVTCEPTDCALCPPCATAEGEPACAPDYIDQYNPGCNGSPPAFTPITLGETVCGTSGVFCHGASDYRDTDWYAVVTTQPTSFTFEVTADFPALFGMIEYVEGAEGSGDCADNTGYIAPYDIATPCQPLGVTTECLPAGTYWFFVAPADWTPLACNATYTATLTGETCDFSSTYCDATAGNDEYISRVTVGSIDNSTAWTSPDGYADFSYLATVMQVDQDYPLTVELGNPYASDIGGVWVDWNEDYDFNDPGEAISTAWSGIGPYTATITPPVGTLPGDKRMRIRVQYASSDPLLNPCGDTLYGEVEDYTLAVGPLTLSLEPQKTCHLAGDQVVVDIQLNRNDAEVLGGLFYLAYDNTKLDFVSINPGDAPFTVQEEENVDEPAGEISYTVAVPTSTPPAGFTGSNSIVMARITFDILVDNCDVADAVTWRDPDGPPPGGPLQTRLTQLWNGLAIPLNLDELETIPNIRLDRIAPDLTLPADVEVDCLANACAYLWPPSVTDNCGDPFVWYTEVDNGGAGCPVDPLVLTRTWYAEDECGNVTSADHMITIIDDVAPVFSDCPTDISVTNDPGTCAAVVTWTVPVVTDNCDNELTPTASHNPGDTFTVGTTTVTYDALDSCGNPATCSFTVTVTDDQPPVALCQDITIQLDAAGDASIIPTDIDAGSYDNCGIASLNVFPDTFTCADVGGNTVTLTVTDVHGNSSTCSATVTVVDNTPPTIVCPADVQLNADAGTCAAATVVLGTPITADNCGVDTVVNDAPETFPVGITTVTWTVTDVNGNTNTCTQTVTVLAYTDLVVDVELQGALDADVTRCITFLFYETCDDSDPLVFERDILFDANTGLGHAEFTFAAGDGIACGNYPSVLVQDSLHTLTQRLALGSAAFYIDAGRYIIDCTGGDMLLQGDLYDDTADAGVDYIDVVDIAVYIAEWGVVYDSNNDTVPDGDTPCHVAFDVHADSSASGYIDTSDRTFISTNYLMVGEQVTCPYMATGSNSGTGPRESISVAELRALGLPQTIRADLNDDGFVDQADIDLFNDGVRPDPIEDDAFDQLHRREPQPVSVFDL